MINVCYVKKGMQCHVWLVTRHIFFNPLFNIKFIIQFFRYIWQVCLANTYTKSIDMDCVDW